MREEANTSDVQPAGEKRQISRAETVLQPGDVRVRVPAVQAMVSRSHEVDYDDKVNSFVRRRLIELNPVRPRRTYRENHLHLKNTDASTAPAIVGI